MTHIVPFLLLVLLSICVWPYIKSFDNLWQALLKIAQLVIAPFTQMEQ
jgi:hypothetical protein